jgi:hypothetical protein
MLAEVQPPKTPLLLINSHMTEKTLSQAAFARKLGVSAMAVSRWRVQGWLVLAADGRIDVAASEERLRTRPEVYRGGRTVRPR